MKRKKRPKIWEKTHEYIEKEKEEIMKGKREILEE